MKKQITDYKIILNPFAGKGRAFHKIKKIKNCLEKLNLNYEMEITHSPKQAIKISEESANAGFKNLIAAGGDGTINEVINGIMRSENSLKINFGIIPIGGGNDFVKNFDYPDQIKAQIDLLQKGKTKKIDVGKIEKFYFINTLGIGFDAQVAINYHSNKFLNGFLGYLAAVLKSLIKNSSYSVAISVKNRTFSQNIQFISIGNGISCGGKFKLTPNAKIDDKLFDFCIIDPVSRRRLLKLLPKAIKGNHIHFDEVNIFRGTKICVSSNQDLPVYMDGEIPDLADSKNITVRIIPHSINLIIDENAQK